jgi:hypothetical protein
MHHRQPINQNKFMSTRVSETIVSLHDTRSVDLEGANIDAEGAAALAEALKGNTSVTSINIENNRIGAEGASALANALKENTSVTDFNLAINRIGAEGASALADALKLNRSVMSLHLFDNAIRAKGALALADALKVNTSVTAIDLEGNQIGADGATALADALKVNTSLTSIDLDIPSDNRVGRWICAIVRKLLARNKRLRCLFLFDARQMLLSLMCADECSVVWPYLLDSGNADIVAPENVEAIRPEFDAVVEERRRCADRAARLVETDVDECGSPAVKRCCTIN